MQIGKYPLFPGDMVPFLVSIAVYSTYNFKEGISQIVKSVFTHVIKRTVGENSNHMQKLY
jgi:hypothetical protein